MAPVAKTPYRHRNKIMSKIVKFPRKYRAKREETSNFTISEELNAQDQYSLFTTDHRFVQPRFMRHEHDTPFDIGADLSDAFDTRSKK
jgi:hypothetical protein